MILGLVGFRHLHESVWFVYLLLFVFSLMLLFLFRRKRVWLRVVQGVQVMVVLLAFGSGLQFLHDELLHRKTFVPQQGYYLARVEEIARSRGAGFVSVVALFPPDSLIAVEPVNIQLVWPSDSTFVPPRLHALFSLYCTPDSIRNDPNPFAFDYRSFMGRKGIWYTARVDSGDFKILNSGLPESSGSWQNRIDRVREHLLHRLRNSQLSADAAALTAALVLGYKYDLDQEVKQTFSEAGVVHVLAVSGLHVGIIYLILDKLFLFLSRRKRGIWIRYALILAFLWFYVFLAGFSASVFRAALMFSLFQTAKVLRRDASIYNVMAASAFIILVYNPHTLYELGFLFSYLAVAGIVLLHSFLYRKIYIRWKVLDYAYSAMLVSFSAQLLVTPISLYYFQQFPSYFLLANLLILPLVVAFIYPAILFVMAGDISLLARLLSLLLNGLFEVLAFLSEWIVQFPGALVQGIYLDQVEVWLAYVVIISLLHYVLRKFKPSLVVLLALLFIFSGYRTAMQYQAAKGEELMVFSSPGSWLLGVKEQRTCYLLYRDGDPENLRRKVSGYLKHHRIKEEIWVPLDTLIHQADFPFLYHDNYLFWKDKVYFFQDNSWRSEGVWAKAEYVLSPFPLQGDTSGIRENIYQRSYSFSSQNMLYKRSHELAVLGARKFD